VEGSVERAEGCHTRVAVEVKDGAFSWDDESQEAVLKSINLNVNKGELTAIVGTVGSGKSSLLASILGEMHKLSGKVRVHFLFDTFRISLKELQFNQVLVELRSIFKMTGNSLWDNCLCSSNIMDSKWDY
jgi:ABC-type transport system involved in cytochrome bd biosynthesis fused ATPase/permease subunit